MAIYQYVEKEKEYQWRRNVANLKNWRNKWKLENLAEIMTEYMRRREWEEWRNMKIWKEKQAILVNNANNEEIMKGCNMLRKHVGKAYEKCWKIWYQWNNQSYMAASNEEGMTK